jgi:hypothetical protein
MVARATAPNRIGPGSVFPDAAKWDFSEGLKGSPMASAPFWVALICQLIIVLGYFWFYRKEQLGRFLSLFPYHSCTDLCFPQHVHNFLHPPCFFSSLDYHISTTTNITTNGLTTQ